MCGVRFVPDMTVADALQLHPKARWVFAAYHLNGCNGCREADRETLEQLASEYKLELTKLLADLNSVL